MAGEVEHGLAHRGDERGVGGHTESVGNEGTRIAPVRRESWPMRFPRTPRTVKGAIMYEAIQSPTTHPNV